MAKKPTPATSLPIKDKGLFIRMTKGDRETLKIAATAAGLKTAEWARQVLFAKAKETA